MDDRVDVSRHSAGTGSTWRWDLVGLPWSEAEQILRARGQKYEIRVTAPPNRPAGTGELRVVAQRPRPEGFLLILAYPDYEWPAPRM